MDCTKLHGRMREICEGRSGLPPEMEEQYRQLWSGHKPETIRTDCVYRGEHIDDLACPACEKKVLLKVFACQLHSRCMLVPGTSVRYCGTCESRLEPEAAAG